MYTTWQEFREGMKVAVTWVGKSASLLSHGKVATIRSDGRVIVVLDEIRMIENLTFGPGFPLACDPGWLEPVY